MLKLLTTNASSKPLYAVLGLPETASNTEIKEAYHNIAKAHHPDLRGPNTFWDSVQHAFDVLSDPSSRSVYDTLGLDPTDDNAMVLDGLALIEQCAKDRFKQFIVHGVHAPDLVSSIRARLRSSKEQTERLIQEAEYAAHSARRFHASITRGWIGGDLAKAAVLSMVTAEESAAKDSIVPLRSELAIVECALDLLAQATFKVDIPVFLRSRQ